MALNSSFGFAGAADMWDLLGARFRKDLEPFILLLRLLLLVWQNALNSKRLVNVLRTDHNHTVHQPPREDRAQERISISVEGQGNTGALEHSSVLNQY